MSLFEPKKARSRRNEIRDEVRRQRPRSSRGLVTALRDDKAPLVIAIGLAFIVLASALLMLRPRVVALRPGQTARSPVVSRVDFKMVDEQRLLQARAKASDDVPRAYQAAAVDPLAKLRADLQALPQAVTGWQADQLPRLDPPLGGPEGILDGATLGRLQSIAASMDPSWPQAVDRYVDRLIPLNLILLPADRAAEERAGIVSLPGSRLVGPGERLVPPKDLAGQLAIPARRELENKISNPAADAFPETLYPKVVAYTLATLGPTHELDEAATTHAQQLAADRVPAQAGEVIYRAGQRLLPADHLVTEADWELLREENAAFRDSLGTTVWRERIGLLGLVILLTGALGVYAVKYEPKVVKNPVRTAGMAFLLLAALLIAQLAALGTSNMHLLGIGPILLATMTVCIAYEGRFAVGVGSILALLVTLGLGQGIGYYLICFTGILVACFLLNEIRSRSKLIEVGGIAGISVAVATLIVGMARMDEIPYALTQAAWAALAGFAAGGVVLCALPFIERVFHITTGLTLLEYQDHPLLRRLALEAPGTYNHSLQVASISEEAASAIGADSLLCRVACYYHDIGKLRKPEYFIENQHQVESGEPAPDNPHLTLNPSMSLLIIIGHVKDGLAMAKEWALPRTFLPFIEQHHGTTLVEYFYREAVQRQKDKKAQDQRAAEAEPADCDYRYPGPRPRSREAAIVMMCDCCESACRAMSEPTPNRIEARVNDLIQKRLLDHQFDECPITMGELEKVRRSIVKSLVAVYHGRIAYPSDRDSNATGAPTSATTVYIRPTTAAG